MSKRCASCTKAVYPVEELKCLDQIWHKTCFRCQECKMTLNMKNYKGYNKKPYCNAHYPTTKFTSVADTPESRRIAANTKIQSNIQYHKAFEDAKGKYTAVADDPETRRLKHNSDLISQVEYHGIRQKREVEERHRPELDAEENDAGIRGQQKRPVGKIADYNPAENVASPYSARTQNMPTVYDTEKGGAVKGQGGPKVGKIEDYAPQPYEYGGQQQLQQQQGYQDYNPPPPQQVQQPPPPKQEPVYPPPPKQPCYRAMYDYSAADTDEVSFKEGDVIIDVTPIDAGWMEGRVQRTGQYGMLPANYVERS